MATKTKTFDCVEMKHRGAEMVLKTIGGTSLEEELKFWREGTEELRKRQAFLIQNQSNRQN